MTASEAETTAAIESFSERVDRLWDGNADSTTALLLTELGLTAEQIMVLHTPVRDRVWHHYRSRAKAAERVLDKAPDGFRRSQSAVDSQSTSALREHSGEGTIIRRRGAMPDLNDPLSFLDTWVALPGLGYEGGGKLWRDMTIADHSHKIGQLSKHVHLVTQAIHRHEWAQDKIAAYRVTTLGEIPEENLLADLQEINGE
jgi:hypothetical protein